MNKKPFFDGDGAIRKWGAVSFGIFLLIQLLQLLPPRIMKVIVDEFIPSGEVSKVAWGIAIFILVPCVYVGGQTAFQYFTIKFARNKGNELAIRIMGNLLRQPMSFFDTQNSMELVSYSSKESVGYINFRISNLPQFYAHALIVLILVGILWTASPIVALLQVIFIPAAIFPVHFISKRLEGNIEQALTNNAKINQTKSDLFRGIEFVKSMCLEERKLTEVQKYNEEIVGIWGRISALDSLAGLWIPGFLSLFFTGITFGLCAYLVMDGKMTMGALISSMSYVAMVYFHVNRIFQTRLDLRRQEAEYRQLFSYLEMSGEDGEGDKKPFSLGKEIRIENYTFQFEQAETPALDGVSLLIPVGEWTGIIGKSGSGKSTVLDLLLKLYPAGDGEIFLDDTDINQVQTSDLRKHITRVAQEIFLFPGTIRDNLLLACPEATDNELKDMLEFVNLSDYIATLPEGLDTDIGEAGKLMSGGERQRLSLAQGLLRGNSILLLDEVTSGLDPATEADIRQKLHYLVQQEGYTILSVSHDLEFLNHADYIYEIRDGKLIAEGEPSEF